MSGRAEIRVVVTVIEALGSVPREVGARMVVSSEEIAGTIGGGALEHGAIGRAKALLERADQLGDWHREIVEVPLGPALQQCCGGWVKLAFEVMRDDQVVDRGEGSGNSTCGFAIPTVSSRGLSPGPMVPEMQAYSVCSMGPGNKCRDDSCGCGVRRHRIELPRGEGGLLVRPLVPGVAPMHLLTRQDARRLPLPIAGVVQRMLSGLEPRKTTLVDVAGVCWLVEPLSKPHVPLLIYGAGHVGRELVRVLAGVPFEVTWIDFAPERFPQVGADGALRLVTDHPDDIAAAAPPGAFHIVLTHSHALDEAITAAALRAGVFGYVGLIGSQTKRARFVQRFRRAGIAEASIVRLTCPIGAGITRSKHPASIAIAAAAELIGRLDVAAARKQDPDQPQPGRRADIM